MSLEPRVLIVAGADDWSGPLSAGLDLLGWPTVTAHGLDGARAAVADFLIDVIILDASVPGIESFGAELGERPSSRRLKVLAVGDGMARDTPGIDMRLAQPPHPAQAAAWLEQLARAAVTEEELELRQATFALQDVALTVPESGDCPIRILVAGAADARFISLSNALTTMGAEVVAAPTPYTAFDYLHESVFDAAVLWGTPDLAPALSIAAGIKRNTRLYHIPITLYQQVPDTLTLAELFSRGFAEVAAPDTPQDELAQRVIDLARLHRRHADMRKALDQARGSELTDPETGLFTRDLFARHLSRISQAAVERRRPLSVAVLRVANTPALAEAREGGWLDRAMPQIGAMVSRLVRVEDTAARLSAETFALALPATPAEAARLAVERIAAVIGCTAFDAGPDRSPFVVAFDIGTAQVRPGQSIADVLDQAHADLIKRREAPA